MMKEFNCYNLAKPYNNYRAHYNMLVLQVSILMRSIENNNGYYISIDARRVREETLELAGYIECLYDLCIISESDYEKFLEFIYLVRHDVNFYFN